jgi:hypothetical protein
VTVGVSPNQVATPWMLAVMVLFRLRAVGDGSAFAKKSAISTVAFQVRNSFAVKWPPASA